MSSKNQSESTAAVQEELTESPIENVAETESVEESVVGDDVQPGAEGTGQATTVAATETSSAGATTNDSTSEAEFKVTDKRRFVVDEAETSASSAEGDSADAFEIDLDQMQLDAQAVERELEEMRVKLRESEARRDEAVKTSEEYADRFRKAQLQLRAETEEVRARMQRTFDQRLELARGDVVASLLDTLDNLQRAVVAAEVATDQGAAFDALRDGVRATAEMFEAQLKKLGLQAVVSEGEPFNPEVHEAVELAIVPREQDGVVITELQRGYKFGERLLRPARVKVGRAG